MQNYQVVFEATDTGFSAFSPDVPGVGVAAETRDEAERLLDEAIAFYFEPEESDVVVQSFTTHLPSGNFSIGYAPSYTLTYVSVNTTLPVPAQAWPANYSGPQRKETLDVA